MTEKFQNVIQSAARTLALLSKIRCVEGYSPSPECKKKNFSSWPTQFDSDADVVSLLVEKGVRIGKPYWVETYPVPYDTYEKLSVIDIPEVIDIRKKRTLLDVVQITNGGRRVTTVTAAWDTLQHPDRNFPSSMSDINGLDAFSAHKDSMLVFDRENEKYSIKLRASAFRSVLKSMPELGSLPIVKEDRSSFIGSGGDGKGRSKRFIVHNRNRGNLEKVLRQTSKSIETIFGKDN